MTVAVSAAVEEGAEAVICASTGNTAASAAAYAARAGLRGAVIVPEGKIAAGKLAQALMHGARVIALKGNFDEALALTRQVVERNPIALVNSLNDFRIEGQKTGAFEVCDQLGEAPDVLCIPVGNAGNVTAWWKGFQEYETAPVLHGYQAAGAAPLVEGRVDREPGDGCVRDPDRQPRALGGRDERVHRLARRGAGGHRRGDPGGVRAARPPRGRVLRAGLRGIGRRADQVRRRGPRRLRPHRPRPQGPDDGDEPGRLRRHLRPGPRRGRAGGARASAPPPPRAGARLEREPRARLRLPRGGAVAQPRARGRGDRASSSSTPTCPACPPTARTSACGLSRRCIPPTAWRSTSGRRSRWAPASGSSAAAIVAGLVAADHLYELDAPIFEVARELEGHPDNVAAALRGGFVDLHRRPGGPVRAAARNGGRDRDSARPRPDRGGACGAARARSRWRTPSTTSGTRRCSCSASSGTTSTSSRAGSRTACTSRAARASTRARWSSSARRRSWAPSAPRSRAPARPCSSGSTGSRRARVMDAVRQAAPDCDVRRVQFTPAGRGCQRSSLAGR